MSFSVRSLGFKFALLATCTGFGFSAAPSARAAAIDFNAAPWSSRGSVSFPDLGQAASLSTGSGATEQLSSPDLTDFLGLAGGDLDPSFLDNAYEGSALKRLVQAGDQISLDWNFSLFSDGSSSDLDYAFVLRDGVVQTLTGSSGSFATTFANSGWFAIGVVDVNDDQGDSVLALSTGDFQAVPTPGLLPALLGFGVSCWRRRRSAH